MSSPYRRPRVAMEVLEPRRMLSAQWASPAEVEVRAPQAAPAAMTPASAGMVAGGYTPTQIRHAYGFDQVHGDGTGQTIAIVDAYHHPRIAADLATFNARFGIGPAPSLTVVGQSGGPFTSLRTNGPWASETAMDVEWAHAIAPNADLLLVETNTDTIPDLMSGVDVARKVPGVSVVALSWSGPEFRGQLKFDPVLTTPANHQGVTFVAAAGDNGLHGATWPSSCPTVLSVGGTTLYTRSAEGDYSTEVAWRGTSGGLSRYERRPAFQAAVAGRGNRSTPDVAYSADPNMGFAVYSSVPDGDYLGWSSIAGTSAGVPQWAGQVAIADQLRTGAGLSVLDGAAGTLPALYQLYSPPHTAGFANYTATFNDITVGRASSRARAGAGYDQMTGLGSPKAPEIVGALTDAAGGPAAVPTHPVAGGHVARPARARRASPAAERGSGGEYRTSTPVPTPRGTPAAGRSNNGTQSEPARTVATATVSIPTSAMVLTPAAAILATINRGPLPQQLERSTRTRLSYALPVATANRPNSYTLMLGGTLGASTQSAGTSQSDWTVAAAEVAGPATVADIANAVSALPAVVARKSGLSSLLDLDHTEGAGVFADAMSDFAYESTALGSIVAARVGSHARAWTVTFTVLAVDAVLIGWWRAGGRLKRKTSRDRMKVEENPFTVFPV